MAPGISSIFPRALSFLKGQGIFADIPLGRSPLSWSLAGGLLGLLLPAGWRDRAYLGSVLASLLCVGAVLNISADPRYHVPALGILALSGGLAADCVVVSIRHAVQRLSATRQLSAVRARIRAVVCWMTVVVGIMHSSVSYTSDTVSALGTPPTTQQATDDYLAGRFRASRRYNTSTKVRQSLPCVGLHLRTRAQFRRRAVDQRRVLHRQLPTHLRRPALVEQFMSVELYSNAQRVFLIVDNGSAHHGQASIKRLQGTWPNMTVVHTPVHASWLNQSEIYFSIVQRKALQPNNFSDLDALEQHLLAFGRRYEQIAKPLEVKFTRYDLDRVLDRVDPAQALPAQQAAA